MWGIAFLFIAFLFRESQGEAGVTLLRAETSNWTTTFCAVYNLNWGHVPTTNHPTVKFPAEVASDQCMYGCNSPRSPLDGVAMVTLRGNCTFCEKAWFAESANASLLVVIYNESNLLVDMACFHGNPLPLIPVLLISNSSGHTLLGHMTSRSVSLAPFTPSSITIDPSSIVTMVIALATVLLASYLANTPLEFLKYGLLLRKGERYGQREEEEGGGEGGGGGKSSKVKSVMTTLLAIAVFLLLTILLLLLLYFFYYPMVYVVIVMYSVGAVVGLFCLLSPLVALIPLMSNIRLPENKLPLLEYRPDPRLPVLLLVCVGVVGWWVAERHSPYGWILQDILGFAFVTYLLGRLLFLPVWVVAVAMILLFFYDIIMVFITPFMTEDHESVMVKAATGGSSNSEPLPIVFVVPKLLPSYLEHTCSHLLSYLPYSLLGYGDVGVPGLLVAMCLRHDLARGKWKWFKFYFAVSSSAYAVGLVFTFVALLLMRTAQPALLYLVPTTLGSVTLLAVIRKEFTLFFTGEESKVKGQNSKGRGQVQEEVVTMETDTENEEQNNNEEENLITSQSEGK